MSKILDINQIFMDRLVFRKENWTAIIPAAGVGSRLGFDQPKLLYPILGKTLLEHLIGSLTPFCQRFVFVLSPKGKPLVEPFLHKNLPGEHEIVVQERPTGMADAVQLGAEKVETENCLVLWGDQVVLSSQTLQACLSTHENQEKASLTFPVINRQNPYIHFERDQKDQLTRVLHAREEDTMPETGENDCGLFLFSRELLRQNLTRYHDHKDVIGAKTKERNFLSFLPFFEREKGEVVTVRIHDPSETLGINTKEEAQQVEEILKKRMANAGA